MAELPSGTVTLLFTDIEGSTRLLGELGAERYAQALAEHRRALREAFARHGGVEVDTQGDALFVAFPRAAGAVEAASEAQAHLGGGPVRVRIGIHTGEPLLTAEGYVGVDVHRAARVMSAGHGGQVLVSERTSSLLGVDAGLVDLGLHRLKDLGEPVKLFQVGEQSFPPLQTLDATNLPAQPGPLVGRERELEELTALVRAERLVTLTGPGGSGKTRLALQTAAELVGGFSDGVFWVPLATVQDEAQVLPAVGSTLGARGDVASHVDARRMLLLLDNLEQVLGAAPALSELLERCPNLHLLVTSRALLRIAGEREYPVEPLPERDALELFRRRAAVAEPEETVLEICRRVDCLPLAVELAAARTALLTPGRLLERLGQRLPLLTTGRRDAPARQRTLRATIEWSYELLEPQEKELFRRLAVFAGSFEAGAAEAVAGAHLDTLQSLVEKSLLRRWDSGRLGMLETIRELAVELLEGSRGAGELRRRHADHYLALAESANLAPDREGPQNHALVNVDEANVRAALDFLTANDIEAAVQLTVALENFWVVKDPHEGIRRIGSHLERLDELSPVLRPQALRAYASIADSIGRSGAAIDAFERSMAEYRALGDEIGVAIVLHRLAAHALYVAGDPRRARALVDESVTLYRRHGSRKGEALVISLLAGLEYAGGQSDRAIELELESVAIAREIGFQFWELHRFVNLAGWALNLGRPADAERWANEALPLARTIDDRPVSVYLLLFLARLAADAGDPARSGLLWGAAETEAARAPLPYWWEEDVARHDPVARAGADPEFERGRAEGRRLSLDDAVEAAVRA